MCVLVVSVTCGRGLVRGDYQVALGCRGASQPASPGCDMGALGLHYLVDEGSPMGPGSGLGLVLALLMMDR